MAETSKASGKAAANPNSVENTARSTKAVRDETPMGGPTQAEIDGAIKAREANRNTTTPAEAGNAVGQHAGAPAEDEPRAQR